jgi:hypothetical protein
MGQMGTGKTSLLFGRISPPTPPHTSVVDCALQRAFAHLVAQATKVGGTQGRLALSCVDVHGNKMHDLLRASTALASSAKAADGQKPQLRQANTTVAAASPTLKQSGAQTSAPLFVEVCSYQEARHVLHAAHAASVNWVAAAPGTHGAEEGEGGSSRAAEGAAGGGGRAVGAQLLVPQAGGRAHTLVRLVLRQQGGEQGEGGGGRSSLGAGQHGADTKSCLSILDMVGGAQSLGWEGPVG